MGKFDLFNKFNIAVIVLNENREAVFRNNVFKRVFSDFGDIKKFSHMLYYEVCALESNDVTVHSPVFQAYNSKEDFSAHVIYQTSDNKYFYYDMNATKRGTYTIIFLTDVTSKSNLENALKVNEDYKKQIEYLEDDEVV